MLFGFNNPHDVTQWELLCQGHFVDAKLETDDGVEINVHRFILSSSSPYFKAIFTTTTEESELRKVRIKDISSSLLIRLIREIYGEPEDIISVQSAIEILIAADRFLINDLILKCCRYLENHLNQNNSLLIWRVTHRLRYSELENLAWKHILTSFEYLCESSDLLELDIEELSQILSNDKLNMTSEIKLVFAIEKWTCHCPDVRLKQAEEALKLIRINPHVFESSDWEQLSYFENNNSIIFDMLTHRLMQEEILPERIPNSVMISIGGWSGSAANKSIFVFNPRQNMWQTTSRQIPLQRVYYCAEFIQNKIYIIGGYDGVQRGLTTNICFDPLTMKWEKKAPMFERRCYACSAVYRKSIFVCGGYDSSSSHSRKRTVERYCVASNKWFEICQMYMVRSDATAVQLNGSLYVIGGFNGISIHNTVERLDIDKTDRWVLVASLNIRRSGVCSCTHNGKIYVAGGFDGRTLQDSVERYDPQHQAWQLMRPRLNIARSNMSLFSIEKRLVVSGGYDGKNTIDITEEFDSYGDCWKIKSQASLPIGVSGIKPVLINNVDVAESLVTSKNLECGGDTLTAVIHQSA